MGNQASGSSQSKSKEDYAKMFDTFTYAPTSSHRTEANHHVKYKGETFATPAKLIDVPTQLLRTPFWGEWAMDFASGVCPEPRIGQCSIYDPLTDSIVIAYGYNASNQYLNDCWILSLKPLRWRILSKSLLSPREYCSAVLIGRRMYIYGGAYEHEFHDDLHYIDIDTGNVTIVETSGELPSPRTSPAMFASGTSIYMWGGYDGRSHGGIHLFDTSKCVWNHIEKANTGVPAPAFCVHKDQFFVFGAITGTPLSRLDPETGSLIPIQCTGTEPHGQMAHASLVSANDFLVLIGGDFDSKFMNVYALDLSRRWWFAFHVRPDGLTLNRSDGNVGKNGNFQLPREHSASVYYSPREREIVSVMGSKLINPAPVFKLRIANALASIHLTCDMLDLFSMDHGQK
ncbi:Kelch motif family protein [Tritrichomonas foetus]|uniref:Kelch motif family protein n=1 Tax=Tritrichomonas foetus TaxID=1144522 RepID=A0A1J4JD27_9EUKA|nr:Kelch motif family protein [Tritrichomonas foetus]|eukprot:OHS97074.1 Kelch motif family protein [Tritrichomonas foetus]